MGMGRSRACSRRCAESLRPGNSGGPLVDRAGNVLTTVFAGTTGSGPAGGYGVANATVARALGGARGAVATGPCDSA